MNLQDLVFICIMIAAIFISGCVSNISANCDDQGLDYIRNRTESLFGISPADYKLTSIECSDIGNSYKAEGMIGNAYRFGYFYYFSTSPSPSQYNELCFFVEPSGNNTYFETARANACSTLQSKSFCPAWNTTCGIEEYDNSAEVRASCLSGEFDKVAGTKRIFAVRQDTSYSWYAAVSRETGFSECR